MQLALYQVNSDRDSYDIIFRCADYALLVCDGVIPRECYDCVFDGEVPGAENLEQVFEVFNLSHPKGYRGRSLSVSDVVEVKSDNGESKYFYCDFVGFREVVFRKDR